MCGRYSLFAPPEAVEERFGATFHETFQPRYNAAPRQSLPVIGDDRDGEIRTMEWGLVPPWADSRDDGGFINARAETVAEKPAFADAWEARPCLVLSSGFYEWKDTERGGTRPYRVHREDDVAFAMAGIHERWTGSSDALDTVTILTTEPNDLIEPLHHRMAVVLPREEEAAWLTGDPEDRRALCRPYPDDDLDAYPISTTVNDPANDSPGIIEPDESEQSGLGEFV